MATLRSGLWKSRREAGSFRRGCRRLFCPHRASPISLRHCRWSFRGLDIFLILVRMALVLISFQPLTLVAVIAFRLEITRQVESYVEQ